MCVVIDAASVSSGASWPGNNGRGPREPGSTKYHSRVGWGFDACEYSSGDETSAISCANLDFLRLFQSSVTFSSVRFLFESRANMLWLLFFDVPINLVSDSGQWPFERNGLITGNMALTCGNSMTRAVYKSAGFIVLKRAVVLSLLFPRAEWVT